MPPERDALAALSARIGSDPALVQGPGGNTSIKLDGRLHVKGSGTWLAHAAERDIFAVLDLAPLRGAIASDDPRTEDCLEFLCEGSALRPSIETTLHAVMPHRVVVHAHCVETIARAVRTDVEAVIADRLGSLPGIRAAVADYARPGRPLTRVVRQAMAEDTNVLVLRNHGLVVGADSVEEAATLQARVTEALAAPARPAAPGDLATLTKLADGTAYEPAAPHVHTVARDPVSFAVAAKGSLYPDHVIFLGSGVAEATPDALQAGDRVLLVAPGSGLLVKRDATAGARALIEGLALVCARLNPDDPIAVLTEADEHALLNWDAEAFRAKLDRAGGAP
ncbi:MAG: class II aldolase/adducin family protein [Pseudomonadota bacterium]